MTCLLSILQTLKVVVSKDTEQVGEIISNEVKKHSGPNTACDIASLRQQEKRYEDYSSQTISGEGQVCFCKISTFFVGL